MPDNNIINEIIVKNAHGEYENYLIGGIVTTNLPTTDGTYILQLTILDGKPSYSWIAN